MRQEWYLRSHFSSLFLVFFVTLLIWTPVLMNTGVSEASGERNNLEALFILHAVIQQILLLRFSGYISMYPGRNLLPVLLYATFLSLMATENVFNTGVFSGLLIFLCLKWMHRSYYSERIAYQYFWIGLFLSLAGFITPQAWLILPTVMAGLLLFRAFQWREWVYLFLGFFFPLYLVFAFQYLLMPEGDFLQNHYNALLPVALSLPGKMLLEWLITGFLWLCSLLAAGVVLREPGLKVISRNFYTLLALLGLNILLLMALYPDQFSFFAMWFAIPCALLFSGMLLRLKSGRIRNALLWLLVAAALTRQIISLLQPGVRELVTL